MEQTVRVRCLLPDGMAEVVRIRESACSGECHKCSGCGAAQQKVLLVARNPIGAQPGDMVVVSSETKTVLKAAAVLYMLPLVLFIVGYLLGESLWQRGGLVSICAVVLCTVLIKLYDRRLAKKEILYIITGFAVK